MTKVEKKRENIINGLRLNSQAYDVLDIHSDDVKILVDWIDELIGGDPMDNFIIKKASSLGIIRSRFEVFDIKENKYVFRGSISECNDYLNKTNSKL